MNLKQAHYGGYEEREKKRIVFIALSCIAVLIVIVFIGYRVISFYSKSSFHVTETVSDIDLESLEYLGDPYIEINGNIPFFTESELTDKAFEQYSPLDTLGRCGQAYACLSLETMPTEERGAIGMIKPSGWHTVRYDDIIDDKYLYNRCHLIAYALAGENANELNLITGTRYMNIYGMLPFETRTVDYIKYTGNHVLYRVTPFFENKNLVASGVLMEAQSIEDNGMGLMFNVFVYNVQPGIEIDYSTGKSHVTNKTVQ